MSRLRWSWFFNLSHQCISCLHTSFTSMNRICNNTISQFVNEFINHLCTRSDIVTNNPICPHQNATLTHILRWTRNPIHLYEVFYILYSREVALSYVIFGSKSDNFILGINEKSPLLCTVALLHVCNKNRLKTEARNESRGEIFLWNKGLLYFA